MGAKVPAFNSKVFLNRRTGQMSIVLPKKKFKFIKTPKEVKVIIKGVKW